MRAPLPLVFSIGACLLLLSFQKLHVSADCTMYKKGTFYFHFRGQDKTADYTITRSDSTQTETNHSTGNKAVYKIHWSSDCSYELKFLSGTEVLSKEFLDLKRQMIVRTKILSGTKDYYLFESTNNLSTTVLRDTAWLRD